MSDIIEALCPEFVDSLRTRVWDEEDEVTDLSAAWKKWCNLYERRSNRGGNPTAKSRGVNQLLSLSDFWNISQ